MSTRTRARDTSGFRAPGDALPRPHGNCYWLWPGRILAGEHPFAGGAPLDPHALDRLLDAGVRAAIDLTEASEGLADYDTLWTQRLALRAPIATAGSHPPPYERLPVRDYGLPTPEVLDTALASLRRHLDAGPPVYLHCHGGAGRTGTVAACLMVDCGLQPEVALDWLAAKWQAMDKRRRIARSPETEAQREFVLHRRPPHPTVHPST